MHAHHVYRDIAVLAGHPEIPGLGLLVVNAFVIHATQLLVVGTGPALPGRGFAAAVPGDLPGRCPLDLADPPRRRPALE